jgi:hypothetical protein
VSTGAREPTEPQTLTRTEFVETDRDDDASTRLSDEQIEEVTSLLRDGRRLPPHLFPHLFEVPKEYELAYRGKAREVDILAETMAVPLQAARVFGDAGGGWTNKLIFGDNLQVLRQLINMKSEGQLRNPDDSDGVRVCYIDPPFATDREFQASKGQLAYTDRVAGAEFVEALRMRLCRGRRQDYRGESNWLAKSHVDWSLEHEGGSGRKTQIPPSTRQPLSFDQCIGTGFYEIGFSWRRGDHTKHGTFNPDLFMRLSGGSDVLVVELKDDDDLSDENRAKYKFAVEHFDRINATQRDVRYRMKFISPDSYDAFFDSLRSGTAAEFVSGLQANLA